VKENHFKAFFETAKPPQIRSLREFCEQEIVLSTGIHAGFKFKTKTAPWTGLLLDEMGSGRWRRMWGTGSAQSGKTLLFCVFPALYHLFEIGEHVILGAPSLDLAAAVYKDKILPVIEKSRFVKYLPTSGAGSRGGTPDVVYFTNGSSLRLMGAQGGDAQKSSHTARVVVLTEVDRMENPLETSEEGSPIDQFENRSQSFGRQALLYAECTTTTVHGRIWRETQEWGSGHSVQVRCPHCAQWVKHEREHFKGWDVPDLEDAVRKATFVCPACGVVLSESDREDALRKPRLVPKDQRLDQKGRVIGPEPSTTTLGMRWTAFHSPLIDYASLAEKEWRASQDDTGLQLRNVRQQVWALPTEDDWIDERIAGLERTIVMKKIGAIPRGHLPLKAELLTVGIDVGAHVIHWVACAWTPPGRGHVLNYGEFEVPDSGHGMDAIGAALDSLWESVLAHGWKRTGSSGELIPPDRIVIDSGYATDEVRNWCVRCDKEKVLPAKGCGAGQERKNFQLPAPGTKGVVAGDGWYTKRDRHFGTKLLMVDTNRWKREVQLALAAGLDDERTIELFQASRGTHKTFALQVTAEREEEKRHAGQLKRWWRRVRKDNHYLDALYLSRAAAAFAGFRDGDRRKIRGANPLVRNWSTVENPELRGGRGWKIGR
jgi:hypothetical protein